jgi:hypothetical protein
MKNVASGNILESVLCANPRCELVLFDRLPDEQRAMLKQLRKDPDFYGILRPRENAGSDVKSVSRDTALLYLTLQQPGRVPEYVRSILGDRCEREITRLILDGVLAVEQDGKFLSGPEAAALIYIANEALPTAAEAEGFLERLSHEAIRYGQSLGLADPMALSSRLYGYNRTPFSPYWKRTLRDSDAVVAYLGIREGKHRELLEREWSWAATPTANDGWLAWQARRFGTKASFVDRRKVACKLYISPKTDQLPEAFPLVLAVLTRTGARHFKVGKNAPGLLRPDKMVAYFSSKEDLIDTAKQLKKELVGCTAQGVPFTAELAGEGLLSWGVDPPAEEQPLPWLGHESWRLWVTNRLAVALIAASADDTASLEPWQFALRRLQVEGVDTRFWTPAAAEWQRSFGMEN